jgi:large subunit ribosomal protein L30
MIRVTYVKSAIGYSQRQKDTVRSLGLRRLGESVLQPDNPAIRGMCVAISHLVEVSPVGDAEVTSVAGVSADGNAD